VNSPESGLPKLYSELSLWWPLLSAAADYSEEAEFARETLIGAAKCTPAHVLELGSGGGNNAFHLKKHFEMTLTDISSGMLLESCKLNPECEHILGDMRTLRLVRTFDAVFIHDAVMYLITEADLRLVMETARLHCKPGGVALIMPDYVRETFVSGVHHGGHDGQDRSLRYLEWTYDADPADSTYTVDFVYMLREGRAPVRIEHDTHRHGLFSRDVWLRLLLEAGFQATVMADPFGREVFVGNLKASGSDA